MFFIGENNCELTLPVGQSVNILKWHWSYLMKSYMLNWSQALFCVLVSSFASHFLIFHRAPRNLLNNYQSYNILWRKTLQWSWDTFQSFLLSWWGPTWSGAWFSISPHSPLIQSSLPVLFSLPGLSSVPWIHQLLSAMQSPVFDYPSLKPPKMLLPSCHSDHN